MATISNILQNPAGYTGYQSLLKKKPTSLPSAQGTPIKTQTIASEQVVAQPATKGAVSAPAGMGSYKGVQINPGTDAQIQAQMRAIDTPTVSQINPPARGVLPDVKNSISPTITKEPTTFSGLMETLSSRAQTPSKEVQDAYLAQQKLAGTLGDLRRDTAESTEGIYKAGGGAKVVQGRLAGVQQANALREQALTGQLAAATDLYGQTLTGQGQQLQALYNAAGLAAPQLGAVGQVPFSPLDMGQGNILGSNAQGGIQGAGALMGELEAAKQRALTGGTAQTNTFANIYGDAQSQAAQISQQRNAINEVGNQVLSLLETNPDINKFALQYGNKKLNQLSTQLSDPRYAALNTYIRTLQARIGTALQAGEIPTAATENASAIANGNLTLNALAATLQAVDAELGAFAETQQQLADYAQGQFGGAGTASNGLFNW